MTTRRNIIAGALALAEILFQIVQHFVRQPRRRFVETQDDAGHLQHGVDAFGDERRGFEHLRPVHGGIENIGERLHGELPAHITPYDLGGIVQAACLAHDIGNPPFGHAGEYAIRDWFRRPDHAYLMQNLSPAERRDLTTYEGNAQGFRIITQLENHRFEGGRVECPALFDVDAFDFPSPEPF